VEFRSAVERYFETPDVDASAGGVFSFRFIYGDGSNGGEDVDLGDEVFVRASTNGGATWTTVATLDLATWKTGSYEDVDIAITGALRAPNVRFRVEQDNFITGNADTWAIDQASLSVAEITSTTTRPAVGDIDVSTSGRAGTAVSTVDRALDQLGAHRAAVGALQGRLESRIEHLGSMHANQAAAHGRITNADFAAETASLVRSRILTEASMAMLVEARGQRALIADLLGEL
jgi:flagellin